LGLQRASAIAVSVAQQGTITDKLDKSRIKPSQANRLSSKKARQLPGFVFSVKFFL